MPITIDPTVGGAASNSYVSEAEAEDYFAARLFSTAWTGAASADTKRAALVMATRRIEQVRFSGTRASDTQALQWPRFNVWDHDTGTTLADDVIPQAVKFATYELALSYLSASSDPAAKDALAKFSALTLPGGLQLTLRDGFASGDDLPPVVWRLLAVYAEDGVTYLERA